MDLGLIKALVGVAPDLIMGGINRTVERVKDFIDDHKTKPGEPGYWNPEGILDPDWWEANAPGLKDTARVAQNATYWADYKKNTGKKPRYPALQMNGAYLQDLNPSQWAHDLDWWK